MIGELYAASLAGQSVEIEHADGTRLPLDSARWLVPIEGDEAMLSRCLSPVLDVGSGPGRLTVELTRRGMPALGIDITPHAVRLTRDAGGLALCRDVFGHLPGSGRWRTVLLADGNIGIGGDPEALLRRVRELVRPGGSVIAEVAPPRTATRIDRVRLRRGQASGGWFTWATVSASDLPDLARRSGFPRAACWTEAGRWFADLR
ncbi:class I SAM-dependent methyltransferase [Sphaerisporangium perillae]|uniref:class I SAM-dependent methyltransferase n=1 Tax=Sphaerisporangium perillae TaxID=2935860 RepID=UPI00200D9994|nr:class I SAM-dependent methyltransferase [Sphaerisporangium perillae]